MAFALVHTVGLDDAAFGTGIQRVQSKATAAATNIGRSMNSLSAPMRAIQSGIAGILGPIGLAVSLVSGVVAIVRSVATYQERIAQKAREEARARQDASASLADMMRQLQVRLGQSQATPLADAVRADLSKLEREIAALDDKLIAGKLVPGSTDHQRWAELASAIYQLKEEALPAAEAMDALNLAQDRAKNAADLTAAGYQMQIELLRMAGRETEALQLAEELRYMQQLDALRRLAGENEALYRVMADVAAGVHADRMRQIEREAEAERARRREEEQERARRNQLDAEMHDLRQRAEAARAAGDEAAAKLLEEQIRLMRELEEIRKLEGITEDERQRRIDRARETSRLREDAIRREEADKQARDAQAQARGAGATAEDGGAGIEAGLTRSGALLRQVFSTQSPEQRNWDRQTAQIEQIKEYLRRNEERARSQPMLMIG